MALEQSTATPEEFIKFNQSLSFDPPVYVQRYNAVIDILSNETWRNRVTKVVDFGCAELKFFKYVKSLDHINYFCAVDVDENVIRKGQYEVKPLTFEYINGFSRNFIVDLFIGSIAQPDARLCDVDAVVCIELIEHLYPDVLEKVPSTIFEHIEPELAIFSTPNADFNVLFNLKTFRHDDHKFEWTRKEFEEWCFCIIEKYRNYEVYFVGIGAGPKGTEHLGCCSQMAVFSKKCEAPTRNKILETMEPYVLYERFVYPYKEDKRSGEQKFMDELMFRINSVRINNKYHGFQRDDSKYEIPITYLWSSLKNWYPTEEALMKKFSQMGYVTKINEEKAFVLIVDEDNETESDEFSDAEDDNLSLDATSELTES